MLDEEVIRTVGYLAEISAFCFLQYSGAVGWLTQRESGPWKMCASFPRRFSSGTGGGRKLRENWLYQVHLEKGHYSGGGAGGGGW